MKITLCIIPFAFELAIILVFHWNSGATCVSEINFKKYVLKNKDYITDYILIHMIIYISLYVDLKYI